MVMVGPDLARTAVTLPPAPRPVTSGCKLLPPPARI